MGQSLREFRFAFRSLRKNPRFSVTLVVTLALGIGGNAIILSAARSTFSRALPFPESSRLVRLHAFTENPSGGRSTFSLHGAEIEAVAAQGGASPFSDLVELDGWNPALGGGPEPERLSGVICAGNWPAVLGVTPEMGRWFTPGEMKLGDQSGVVVVADSFWQRRLNRSADVLGRTIALDQRNYTIVGVMPQGFRFPYNGEVWTPTTITPQGPRDYAVFARLRSGIEISGLASPLYAAAADVRTKYPATTSPGLGFEASPIRESFIDQQDKTVAALTGVAAFFLLLASFNVASLVLARNVSRRKDLEIRAALGATRWALARQGLIEMLLLSLASAAAAVFVAAEAAPWVTALVPRVLSQELNLNVQYSFAEISVLCASLAVVAGMIAGALPLAGNVSIVASGATRMGSRASRSRRERRAMDAFVVFQFAIALALIAGAGLMIRNFAKLTRQDLGVDAQHLVSMRVSTENARFASPEAKRLLVSNLASAANSTAGVLAAGVTTANPFGGGTWTAPIEIEGQNSSADRASESVNHRLITAQLFDAMGIRVLAGRTFTEDDREGEPGVAIVSQRMAKKFWPRGDALGKRVRVNRPGRPWLTVVGIVSDVQDSVAFGAAGTDAEEHAATWYLPYCQNADTAAAQDVIVMVRAAGSPTAVARAVEQNIHAADPELVLFDASNMREFYLLSLSQQHTGSILISELAGFGLLLGALGIYGTLSFNVAERTREVGIRMALGSTQAQILLLTLKDGMWLALISCVIGLAGAWALGRVLASQLSEVSPADPVALIGSAVTMLVVAAFAIYLPSRRAAALDPIIALRND